MTDQVLLNVLPSETNAICFSTEKTTIK